METVAVILLLAAVLIALASRAVMKRFVARKLGTASDALLEIDFWKASSGKPFTRCLLFVELLSWVVVAFLVARLAVPVLQQPKA